MEFNTLCLILSIAAVVLCAVFFAAGVLYRKKVAEKQIGSAEEEARRIINEAIKGGESKKREMLLEAKEEIHKSRSEYEQEVKERRAEVSKQERRLQQKEEALDSGPGERGFQERLSIPFNQWRMPTPGQRSMGIQNFPFFRGNTRSSRHHRFGT